MTTLAPAPAPAPERSPESTPAACADQRPWKPGSNPGPQHHPNRELTGRINRLDPEIRTGIRRLVVLVLLMPVTVLIATRIFTLGGSVLAIYGIFAISGTWLLIYTAFTRYQDPADETTKSFSRHPESFPKLSAVPPVSLMVAVKDEAPFIEDCIRSLAASDYPDLELIVVDDASTDGTTGILRLLRDELGFTLLENEVNLGKKHALVRACGVARGEILAFTDSDCLVAADAVSQCVRAMVNHPELGAVSGHARAQNTEASLLTRMQDVWYEGQFRIFKAAEATAGSVSCVSGPMAVFRREAIYNYLPAWANDRFLGGEFRFATDRQLTGYVLGQKWVGEKLKAANADSPFVSETDYRPRKWHVGYVRSARVTTIVPPTMRAFVRQQVRWKKSFIRNLCFSSRFMWRRGPRPTLIYYGHAALVLLAPVMAARHLIYAPLTGAWLLSAVYLAGVLIKGFVWAAAYRYDNPGDPNWRYRPLMSLLASTVLSWILPYSLLTIRRGIWSRKAA